MHCRRGQNLKSRAKGIARSTRTLTFDPLPHRERGKTEQSDGGLTMNEPILITAIRAVLLEI
jgi:hypothetical protein